VKERSSTVQASRRRRNSRWGDYTDMTSTRSTIARSGTSTNTMRLRDGGQRQALADAHRKLQATRLPIGIDDRRIRAGPGLPGPTMADRSNWVPKSLAVGCYPFPALRRHLMPRLRKRDWRKRTPRRPSELTTSKSTIRCCRCNTQMLTRQRNAAL